jgi:Holliday junction resolvase-like predicted endonuclease
MSPEKNLVLVEVKSMANDWSLAGRVSLTQQRRLERCRTLCESRYNSFTELLYVFVFRDEIITLSAAALKAY